MGFAFFPNWDRKRLESTAREHADALAFERTGEFCASENIDRLVVNMLRHEFTQYDAHQSQQAHQRACTAVKDRYPWLASECDYQISRREDEEKSWAAYLQAQAEYEQEQKVRRQERSAKSAEAIKTLEPGMTGVVRIKGHERVGTITKVARKRVTLSYRIKSGATREAVVYASEVKAPEQA